jgi:hypothetical protein
MVSWGGQQKEEEMFKGWVLGWDWGLYHLRRSSNVLLAAVGAGREDPTSACNLGAAFSLQVQITTQGFI